MSVVEGGMMYGQYVSQYTVRSIFSNGVQSSNGQYLIGDGTTYTNGRDISTLTSLRMTASEYNFADMSSTHAKTFLAWVKSQLRLGYPVSIGVYAGASYTEYDHIVTVTKVESNYNDNNYYDSDIITIVDHGQSGGTSPSTMPYYFSYTFLGFQGTRSRSQSSSQDYFLPSDYTGTYATGSYGIAYRGILRI